VLFGHGVAERGLVVAGGQHLALVAEDGDPAGLQVGHGAGDQVADGADLAGARVAADADHHRGRRLLPLVLEQLPARQHQVDAGRGDPLQRTDGAGELALERALAVQVLDEVGLAERGGAVEDLVADRTRGRQALARQHQTGRGDLVARHHDGRAVALGLVLHPGLVERLGDGRGLAQVEVGIEQGLGLGADAQDQGEEGRGDSGGYAEDGDQPPYAESLHQTRQHIHEARPPPGTKHALG
jgi:hypothetical protein